MTRPSWVDSRLYPFEDRWLDVDGSRVHYVDEGSGPPLLMLHGNPTWSFLWRELIRGLRDRFRCLALDYPGFGLSSAPAGYGFTPAEHAGVVERVVEALDLRDAGLVVQDWGGPIGFAVATRHPERFARFVIGNTWAWPATARATRAFSRVMGGPVGGLLIDRRNFFVERLIPGGVRRRKLAPAVMDQYRGPFRERAARTPIKVLPREIVASAPFLGEVERGLERVRDRPALILWPDRDVAFGKAERERWERTFPDHRTLILRGAGHFFPEDAPTEAVAAIRAWA
jgi:haloalkane dehalogenase